MTEIIGVRFKSGGKQYYFDPKGLQVALGQGVILETARGIEYGECVKANTMVPDETVVPPLRPVVRLATEEDEKTVAREPGEGGQGLPHLPGEDRPARPGDEAGGGGV